MNFCFFDSAVGTRISSTEKKKEKKKERYSVYTACWLGL